ncbi:MAG: TIGR02281 family clan AA aspartic protease [Sphingomonadales bacterium]|nr:TIGR02281 family clan AA aspartic protease [Sphingomonadales bacterium]
MRAWPDPSTACSASSALLVAPLLRHRDDSPVRTADAAPLVAGTRSPWAPDAPKQADGSPNPFAGPAVISRDRNGTFHLNGAINGRSLDMLVDTGATVVAIPATQAADLGIVVQPDEFRATVRTASGTASAAPVRIASLTIGTTELRDVEGVVVEGLDRILLGQSALARLGKVSIDGDHMAIGGN